MKHESLKPVWLKAAVLGGLWASIEIIIGSFFHNLRLPFAGTILAANSTILMIAFYQMWPEKGLIWRAGLIAALMKSISPSAIILGPMIGILSEALILEFFIRFFGNNFISLSIAGALSVASALIHKIFSLLILYGFNLVTLYLNIFKFFAKQARMENTDPWSLVILVVVVYCIGGVLSAFLGIKIGNRSVKPVNSTVNFTPLNPDTNNILSINPAQQFSLFLFASHLVFIPTGLLLMNSLSITYAFIFVLAYSVLCVFRYRQSLRRLRKPVFWLQLLVLTFLAAIFWNGVNKNGDLFDVEGLMIGLEMNLRAVFVVIVFSSLGVELRNPVIRDYLFSKGFDKIYSALTLSFTALPVMIEAMPKPGFFLRHPVESFSTMMQHASEWLKVFTKNSKTSESDFSENEVSL